MVAVTSSFTYLARSKTPPNIVRTFLLGTSDYSQWVEKWPTFSRRWDEIRPRNLRVKVANGDKTFNFLRTDKTLLTAGATLSMGFPADTIDLFAGTVRSVSYARESCEITIVDKFQPLADRVVGTTDTPLEYVGSEYLPSDIAWWIVTSYGGFDTTKSSTNTDIDYDAFQEWAAVFSADSVGSRARFTGQRVTEILQKISRSTLSAIFIKENKLSFHRFSIGDPNVSSLGADQLHDVRLSFDIDDVINRQSVSYRFRAGSTHLFTYTQINTASVNSFGKKENIIADENFWYHTSLDAANLTQRLLLTSALPEDTLEATVGLVGLPRVIGETITIIDAFHGISENYRILEHEVNMDEGKVKFMADRRQLAQFFYLDTSSLDSTVDILT